MKCWFTVCSMLFVIHSSAQKLQFNDETTTVSFSTPHVIMQLKGTFTGVDGSGLLDPANLNRSFLKLSFASSTALHNDHFIGPDLTKKDCLDPANYPTIQLTSDIIEKLPSENEYLFKGSLTVKNITQTVTFSFTAVPNIGGYDYNFSFPIPRRTYDLNCRCGEKFNITVKGYGKKVATI